MEVRNDPRPHNDESKKRSSNVALEILGEQSNNRFVSPAPAFYTPNVALAEDNAWPSPLRSLKYTGVSMGKQQQPSEIDVHLNNELYITNGQNASPVPSLRVEVDVGETLHMTEMFLDEILNDPTDKEENCGYNPPYSSGYFTNRESYQCEQDTYMHTNSHQHLVNSVDYNNDIQCGYNPYNPMDQYSMGDTYDNEVKSANLSKDSPNSNYYYPLMHHAMNETHLRGEQNYEDHRMMPRLNVYQGINDGFIRTDSNRTSDRDRMDYGNIPHCNNDQLTFPTGLAIYDNSLNKSMPSDYYGASSGSLNDPISRPLNFMANQSYSTNTLNGALISSQVQLIPTSYPTFSKARRLTVKELLSSARDKKLTRKAYTTLDKAPLNEHNGNNTTCVSATEPGQQFIVALTAPNNCINPHPIQPPLQQKILRDEAFWLNYDFSTNKRAIYQPNTTAANTVNSKRKRSQVAFNYAANASKTADEKVHKASTRKNVCKKKTITSSTSDGGHELVTVKRDFYAGMPPLRTTQVKAINSMKQSPSSLIHWEPSYDESSNSLYGDDSYLSRRPITTSLFPPNDIPSNDGCLHPNSTLNNNYETFLDDLLRSEPQTPLHSLESSQNEFFNEAHNSTASIIDDLIEDMSQTQDPASQYTPIKENSQQPTRQTSTDNKTRSRHFDFSHLSIGDGFQVDSMWNADVAKDCHFRMKVLVAQRKILYEFPLILTPEERISLERTSVDATSNHADDSPVSFITNVEIDFKFIEQIFYKGVSLVIKVSCAPRIRIIYKTTNNPACYTKYSLQSLNQITYLRSLPRVAPSYHEIWFKKANTLDKFKAYILNLQRYFPQTCTQLSDRESSGQLNLEANPNFRGFSDVAYSPNITLYEVDPQWYDPATYNVATTPSAYDMSDHYQSSLLGAEQPRLGVEYEIGSNRGAYSNKQPHTTYSKEPLGVDPIVPPDSPNLKPSKVDDLNAKRKRLEAVAFRFAKDYCKCTSGCNTLRCICVKTGSACSASQEHNCQCLDCQNPLNGLRDEMASCISTQDLANTEMTSSLQTGFNNYNPDLENKYEIARSDICLMQNIYQITNLKTKLNTLVKLSCCGGLTLLKRCIPGTVDCPNKAQCRAKFKYSWCLGIFFDELTNPRNHCEICRRCVNKNYQHCYKCNRCYIAGLPPNPCSNCYPPIASNQNYCS